MTFQVVLATRKGIPGASSRGSNIQDSNYLAAKILPKIEIFHMQKKFSIKI